MSSEHRVCCFLRFFLRFFLFLFLVLWRRLSWLLSAFKRMQNSQHRILSYLYLSWFCVLSSSLDNVWRWHRHWRVRGERTETMCRRQRAVCQHSRSTLLSDHHLSRRICQGATSRHCSPTQVTTVQKRRSNFLVKMHNAHKPVFPISVCHHSMDKYSCNCFYRATLC